MIAKEWYKGWFNSPFYHKLYFQHDENEAQQFISRLINYLHPPADSRMVDYACGRGRHSRILASYGFDVTGIDISLNSINYARQFENDQLHFYQHDMRLPFRINYFDYAFNFFTSFGYFSTRREHEDAIRTVIQSLKPSGTLVIDYLNVHYSEEHLVHNEIKNVNGTEYRINRWMDDYHFFKKIVIADPSLSQPIEFTEKVAKFSPGDFMDMLSFQHMQVLDVFGDYKLNPYDVHKTPRMIVVARKSGRRPDHTPGP
jgi:SAM-dependent methyltransferase